MATTIDATIMGEDANSYADLSFADSYFENHFNSVKSTAWNNLSDEQKSQVLVQACYDLEQFRFTEDVDREHSIVQGSLQWDSRQGRFTAYVTPTNAPVPYSVYQALQFPRNRDVKSDGSPFIPPRIQMAQCEQAIYLVTFDETAIANRLQGINLDSISVGELRATQEYQYQGTTLAPLAFEFIKTYLYRSSRMSRA
jgi:hypothetical protein